MSAGVRRIAVVFFDLGNTLMFYSGDLNDALSAGARAMGDVLRARGYTLEPPAMFERTFLERLHQYYGWRDQVLIEIPTARLLDEVLRGWGIEAAPAHLSEALAAFYAPSEACWQPDEEAVPTLAHLRRVGYRLGVISNAGDAADVHYLVEKAGLQPYLDEVIVSAEVGRRKPHPDIFTHALRCFGVEAAQAVMVGDLLWADVWGAQQVGMRGVWLTRHLAPDVVQVTPVLVQPDARLERLSALPALLAQWDEDPPA
ncbi:HAD family hydrolase [Thermanaerothrix sp. 4228-RoL]|uniref:HAD family hydrolase n=1 Tax=Thermanaerothrix solaris TaxID=3058434 RepID=A0ABU3NR03_9CHLR|nr:HAD family hydrolase [Thermanaerothrix sp. 4228-RoL]MDT8898487.1 HAD family hydrolase [Thermanaerothrix sp. 4228-RoL]